MSPNSERRRGTQRHRGTRIHKHTHTSIYMGLDPYGPTKSLKSGGDNHRPHAPPHAPPPQRSAPLPHLELGCGGVANLHRCGAVVGPPELVEVLRAGHQRPVEYVCVRMCE